MKAQNRDEGADEDETGNEDDDDHEDDEDQGGTDSSIRNVVQCKDGPLELTRIQKDWFDENMKPEGIRRTTTKALLMAMLVQLQA